MNVCGSCATKLLYFQSSRPSLKSILRHNTFAESWTSWRFAARRSATTLSHIVQAAPLPPPVFGAFRQRLAKWEDDHGRHLNDPTSAESETRWLKSYTGTVDGNADQSLSDSETWEEELGEAGAISSLEHILPGSLVEITPTYSVQDPLFAVSLRSRGLIHDLLTINGRVVTLKHYSLKWHLPRWMDPADLDPLIPYLPRDELELLDDDVKVHDFVPPREITGSIISALNAFRNEIHSIYRAHASTLDNAHDLLAHPSELVFGTLPRIAGKLMASSEEQLSPAIMYTVRKALLRQPIGFKPISRYQRRAQLWHIHSKEHMKIVQLARDWIRDYRDAITIDAELHPRRAAQLLESEGYQKVKHFIEHARSLIRKSREHRKFLETGLAPSSFKGDLEFVPREKAPLKDHESIIIQFFENWCVQRTLGEDLSFCSLPSFVLQEIGLYEGHDANLYLGQTFLQELGCISPSTNPWLYARDLMLPGTGQSAQLDKTYNMLHSKNQKMPKEDAMADLRHDWGDLPVICIDDTNTLDVDDGFSIEPAKGSEDQVWVRIHIANPTAFVHPNSQISSLGRQLSASLYTPDRVFHMLPQHIRDMCSLHRHAPTLTISFKVDLEGNILDQDIRSGRIHNVIHISYDKVDDILGLASEHDKCVLVVGAKVSAATSPRAPSPFDRLSDRQRDMIRKHLVLVHKITKAMRLKRFENGALQANSAPEPSVRLFNQSSYPRGSPGIKAFYDRKHSFSFKGDPIIEIKGQTYSPSQHFVGHEWNARDIVSELMVTSCYLAAKWSWDRKIPQLYRSQFSVVSHEEIMDYKERLLRPLTFGKKAEEYTWQDALVSIQCNTMHLAGIALSRAARHPTLGLPAYLKATSPLRRYSDMVAHWQIEAALRYEDSTGTSLITSDPNRPTAGILPYSKATIDAMLLRLVDRERNISGAETKSTVYWTSHCYHRALYHGQAELPQTHRVILTRFNTARKGWTYCLCTELATCNLFAMERDEAVFRETGGARIYDIWDCTLHSIYIGGTRMVLKPFKLVSRVNEGALQEFERQRALHGTALMNPPEMAI